ncbi:hypothetical protein FMUND_6447 [Fusarium mundagurra]|uniref:Uncharacterized protein n=1 Tax=Fusarium mundagurra TaxID=1567541 RepID=A0A8H5YPA8_9HYPO|nr:hypothetical protein FMUND_6447 [Fusarium mundagurra]
MSDSQHAARSIAMQDAVVESVYQVSKPVMFNMINYNSHQVVSELEPVGVLDAEGVLIGVRFQNSIGNDEYVMAPSQIVPNACIYQGTEDGFKRAITTVFSNGDSSHVHCISVPVLDKKFMANLPTGHREIKMQLRVAKRHKNGNENPVKLQEAGEERAVIILPGGSELLSEVVGDTVSIILEQVPAGRSSAEPSGLVRLELN